MATSGRSIPTSTDDGSWATREDPVGQDQDRTQKRGLAWWAAGRPARRPAAASARRGRPPHAARARWRGRARCRAAAAATRRTRANPAPPRLSAEDARAPRSAGWTRAGRRARRRGPTDRGASAPRARGLGRTQHRLREPLVGGAGRGARAEPPQRLDEGRRRAGAGERDRRHVVGTTPPIGPEARASSSARGSSSTCAPPGPSSRVTSFPRSSDPHWC